MTYPSSIISVELPDGNAGRIRGACHATSILLRARVSELTLLDTVRNSNGMATGCHARVTEAAAMPAASDAFMVNRRLPDVKVAAGHGLRGEPGCHRAAAHLGTRIARGAASGMIATFMKCHRAAAHLGTRIPGIPASLTGDGW